MDELDGVDECIGIKMYDGAPTEQYWDDEVKQDLDTLSYGRLIFFFQGCKIENETLGCFSGGFIRDLSAKYRIIISSSNETTHSYAYYYPGTGYLCGYFSREFIHALNPEGYIKWVEGTPIWVDSFGDADCNNDNYVSIQEAFAYAYRNDIKRIDGSETPQLEDNGSKIVDKYDLLLSMETCFASGINLKTPDINDDGIVNTADASILINLFGVTGPSPADLNNDLVVNIYDALALSACFWKYY